MESTTFGSPTSPEVQWDGKLMVLNRPQTPLDQNYQYHQFLSELQSYSCVHWKRTKKPRIREVFVVDDIAKPERGRVEKVSIRRKTRDFVELETSKRFDIRTGRHQYGEQKYIFPIDDQRVWNAWEPQSLRRRVDEALPRLNLKDVRAYADLLQPNWDFGVYSEKCDRLFGRRFDRSASLLSERDAGSMASCRESAKKAVLGHFPGAIQEFRALVEMIEGDAKS